ncbi:uncharacterized protein [Triticum aestivum]|uniref:uncharacterized protein n=1 Tax=Triticum aestivum TaxID=4565 RepID=UPI001D01D427|nr:uncharacterized protein LOC123138929 [Triticum aestivum]
MPRSSTSMPCFPYADQLELGATTSTGSTPSSSSVVAAALHRSVASAAPKPPTGLRVPPRCEEEFLMIAEYTSLLAYNQGKIISVYAKQPASWVCASCLSEREDLCWAVKGCARIWWSNCKEPITQMPFLD